MSQRLLFPLLILLGAVAAGPVAALSEASDPAVPRPAIIAVFGGKIDVEHPEFALALEEQQAKAEAADVPDALVSVPADQYVGSPLYGNTFLRVEGSKVIGAVWPEPWYEPSGGERGTTSATRVNEHETGVASRIVGNTVGACPECLVVEVFGTASVNFAWIAHQDWIDAVVIASGPVIPDLGRGDIAEATEAIVDSGKPVFLSNGNNGDEGLRDDDSKRAAPTIKVGRSEPDGRIFVDTQGADFAAWGNAAPIAVPGGTIRHAQGTSYSSPWAAGQYGRFLMEGWESGTLERVVEDGRVRNRLIGVPGFLPTYAADGHLDGPDVRDMIGSFAAPSTGHTTRHNNHLLAPLYALDPPRWSGYGVIHGSGWDQMRAALTDGFPPAPTPAPSHEEHHERRAAMMELHRDMTDARCLLQDLAGPRFLFCDRWWIENDGWYQ